MQMNAQESNFLSHGWLLHFTEREAIEVYFPIEAAHAEVLMAHPDAIAAEPLPRPLNYWP
jgi:hypothetical protein